MSSLVLDASIALSWCFEEEANAYADAALDALSTGNAVVPALWALEVANVLAIAVRKGRITDKVMHERLSFLQDLPIEVEHVSIDGVFGQVVDLATAHALTAYDASYLAVALKRALPLATSDERMRGAAKKLGVALFAPK
ncbi:MAG: type II toxin-antitoxin system VapC family toxin [Planctomycetes bacterium]|nr:type II toxin-antitoxin system VapC family toxin [Planctomycetota bacterium]MCC7172437.1 type II toxin-antitoxin system VapC family toxin [Planctomycetota bacterium]